MADTTFLRKVAAADSRKSKEKNYWLTQLAGVGELEKAGFPYDFKIKINREAHKPAIEGETFGFPPETLKGLTMLSSGADSRLFIILLSGLAALLFRYTGQEDILIGTTITRQESEANLINTVLPIRVSLTVNTAYKELLKQIRETVVTAFENQNYPLETVADRLNMLSPGGSFSLFETALVLGNIQDKRYLQHVRVHIHMLFSFLRTGNTVEGVLEYDALLYKKAAVQRIINHYKKLLHEALENPGLPVSRIDILSEPEKKQILYDFNDTAGDYPRDKTIHELFEEQVERTPDGVGAVGGWQLAVGKERITDEVMQLTYSELDQKSGQLAGVLREKGVLADDIVAIMVERSIVMIIGILGILKAGGAYLPIDPEYPRERIDYMLKDSEAKILLTGNLPEGRLIHHSSNRLIDHHPGNLAYVIYTSGSTGKAKGVLVTQGNVIPVVKNTNYIELTQRDRVLQLSPIAFDGSVFDIFAALLNGASLVMIGREELLDAFRLGDFIKREHITVFFLTTALFNTLVDLRMESLNNVRKILFGGERISVPHAAKALAHLGKGRLLHMYGPTETTVYAACYFINEIDKSRDTIPIGKPLSNTGIFILDLFLTPVPLGVTGEIFIGGPGVAPGYLNRPELTKQKFCLRRPGGRFLKKLPPWTPRKNFSLEESNDQCPMTNDRLYRTGDLARWLPDGNIEFIGRIDHQVKIRGFRIELEEITNRLLMHEGVKEAVVIDRKEDNGETYLCAYIVPAEPGRTVTGAVRTYLSRFLPAYMIPSHIMEIDKIPLTPNGKLARTALPEPVPKGERQYAAPGNDVEKKLVEIWAQVLGMISPASIGIDDDFFELGGHSLKATIMTAQIHRQLHVKVPIDEVFKNPTIRELSEYIEKSAEEEFVRIPAVEKKEYYPLSSAQKRLYIMQHMGVDYVSYNQFMVMVLEGNVQREKLEQTFRKSIQRHESLRTSFEIIGEEPVQRIHNEVKFKVEYYDLAAKAVARHPKAREREEVEKIIHHFLRAFDLLHAPLLRVGLVKLPEEEHILMLDMHHIISDGTSLDIFAREFAALYSGKELPRLRIQYKDFAQWQNRPAVSREMDKQETYWLKQFEGDIPRLNLPCDSPRASVSSNEGAALFFEIHNALTRKIKDLASAAGVTSYMVLLAVYNILLSKYTGQEDIVVGSGIAGRRHMDLQHVIGMFVNMLPMRNRPEGNKTFREFLKEVKENALEAYENQDYQFDQLVEKLGVQVHRESGRNPIFDTQFTFQNLVSQLDEDISKANNMDFQIKPYESEKGKISMQFDLSLSGFETSGSMIMTLEYVKALFTGSYVRGMAKHFIEILEQVMDNRDIRLQDITISHDLQAGKTVLKEEDALDYEF